MNQDQKINILIKKIKKCEKINDELYGFIYEEFCKWIERRHKDRLEIFEDSWWYWMKDYLFYHSLYINSSCLRTLYDQKTYEIFKNEFKKDENNRAVIHKCTGKLLRRWYNLKDQQTSKEKKIILQESHKKRSYLFLLPTDIINKLYKYL